MWEKKLKTHTHTDTKMYGGKRVDASTCFQIIIIYQMRPKLRWLRSPLNCFYSLHSIDNARIFSYWRALKIYVYTSIIFESYVEYWFWINRSWDEIKNEEYGEDDGKNIVWRIWLCCCKWVLSTSHCAVIQIARTRALVQRKFIFEWRKLRQW